MLHITITATRDDLFSNTDTDGFDVAATTDAYFAYVEATLAAAFSVALVMVNDRPGHSLRTEIDVEDDDGAVANEDQIRRRVEDILTRAWNNMEEWAVPD